MSDVTAVLIGSRAPGSPPHREVDSVVEIGSLAALHEAARRASTRLVWLLAASAVPAPAALRELLEHADNPAVSMPVNAADVPLEPLIGRFTEDDVPGILEGVHRHRVPLRHTNVISMLVDRDLISEVAAPDPSRFGPWAGTEWTARLFARHRGMLVPASRVQASPPVRPAATHVLRMARAGIWHRGELLREVHRSAVGNWSHAGSA